MFVSRQFLLHEVTHDIIRISRSVTLQGSKLLLSIENFSKKQLHFPIPEAATGHSAFSEASSKCL